MVCTRGFNGRDESNDVIDQYENAFYSLIVISMSYRFGSCTIEV